jgi:AraC-like DNA-binding protein
MIKAGPEDKIYPVGKIATIVDSLAAEGVRATDALLDVGLAQSALSSPGTRVSLNQVLECCRNAIRLSRDPYFAYRTGLRLHVSAHGMYGFALLSGTNLRQTMHFAVKYRHLATPLTDISFKEEGHCGVWTIVPIATPRIGVSLYRFLVEFKFGMLMSLHRDVVSSSFVAREIRLTYGSPADARVYAEVLGSSVMPQRAANQLVFDAAWLDCAPNLGNQLTFSAMAKICDEMLEEMRDQVGVVGKVREILMTDIAHPPSFNAIAKTLRMPARSLRRRLSEKNTSFRKLADEQRMRAAIRSLRDTDLTIGEIAHVLGFSDAANFRQAFRRWTRGAPVQFRDFSRDPLGVRRPGQPH